MNELNAFKNLKSPWGGAIFDLDGTLLDSMTAWDEIGRDYLAGLGIHSSGGWRDAVKSLGIMRLSHYLRGECGLTETIQGVLEGFLRLVVRYYDNVQLKPGVKQLLLSLQQQGTKLCVATASDRGLAEAALLHNGVLSCFSFLMTCSDAGAGKDKPHLYEQALQQLGTKKENTLVFEDALHAICTAKSAGFPVAAVYDPFAESDQKIIREISDFYISSHYDWNNVLLC